MNPGRPSMFDGPFNGEVQGALGQVTNDDFQGANINLGFVLAIQGMKMGR